MKKQSKIIALVLSLLLLVVACVGITAYANEGEVESEKSLAIISQNVSYSEKMYLYFAVYFENVDTDGLVLNVYSADPDKNAGAELLATVTEHEEAVIPDVANGTSYTCRAFETPGVALKNLATEYFVQAVAKDGTKSAVRRYSVVEYLNEMIFLSKNADEIAAYKKLLAAGDAAQYLLNYYPNDNENDVATNYAYVKVTDGIVTGEYKKGTYLVGEEISLTYTGTEDIKSWKLLDANGELVAQIAVDKSFTVSKSVLCVPSNEEPPVRGTGVYANDANTLTFTNVTATQLSEMLLDYKNGSNNVYKFSAASSSAILTDKSTIDGTGNINASMGVVDNDNALKIQKSGLSGESYYAIASDAVGSGKYVFETDIMIEGGRSDRSNDVIFTFYPSVSGSNNTNAEIGVAQILEKDGVYTLKLGSSKSVEIKTGEWFNFRLEVEDTSSAGNAVRYYVNGELVYEKTNSLNTSVLRYMKIHTALDAIGTMYLDNTYFSRVTQ